MNQILDKVNLGLESKKILIIDDEIDICDLLKEVLSDEGANTFSASDGETALEFLKQNEVDCVLSDVWMPGIDGISLISEIRCLKNCENLPIIMMSGHGTIESAVEATKKGVYDFIEKPLSIERVVLCVQNAINHYALVHENELLKKQSSTYVEPVGKSKIYEAQKQKALELSNLFKIQNTVFIFGEKGTGKNTYARFIHNHSDNAKSIYTHFNVSDLKQHSDLFINLNQINTEYQNGSIVIENVSDLADTEQERLFRKIEMEKKFHYILLASNDENLIFSFKKQTIHNALYLAPLRKNLDDIAEITRFYTDLITKTEGANYRRFDFSAQNLLRNYEWPGNIEELIYIVRKLLTLGGSVQIESQELKEYLSKQNQIDSQTEKTETTLDFDKPLRLARDEFEKEYFLHNLRKVQGNISKLANITGMERTSIHRKIKQLKIDYKDY